MNLDASCPPPCDITVLDEMIIVGQPPGPSFDLLLGVLLVFSAVVVMSYVLGRLL